MADYMQQYADKEVEKLGRKIGQTYRQAAREIDQKMKSFWETHKVISERMLNDVADGKITEQDYKDWLRNQVFRGNRWKAKLDEVTKAYREADEKARKMVGDKNKDIFLHAANWQAKDTSRAVNGAVSFDMYDRKAVDRLLKDDPKMLPEWKIDQKKDYIWNEKRVQNAVAQGIIQGESVYDIGKRLTSELAASNASKMDMFARTAVTGAQNAGRIERLHEAEEMGIKVRKKWLSAHDARVRDAHADLDGQEVDVDKPFHNELGDIMYPGDPSADPANTYNCRCTLIYVYPKYEKNKQNKENNEEETEENDEQLITSHGVFTRESGYNDQMRMQMDEILQELPEEDAIMYRNGIEEAQKEFTYTMPNGEPLNTCGYSRKYDKIFYRPDEIDGFVPFHETSHYKNAHTPVDEDQIISSMVRKRDENGNVIRDSTGKAIKEEKKEVFHHHFDSVAQWGRFHYTDEKYREDFDNFCSKLGIEKGLDATDSFVQYMLYQKDVLDNTGITLSDFSHLNDIIDAVTLGKLQVSFFGGHPEGYWSSIEIIIDEAMADLTSMKALQLTPLIDQFRSLFPNLYKISNEGWKKIWKK